MGHGTDVWYFKCNYNYNSVGAVLEMAACVPESGFQQVGELLQGPIVVVSLDTCLGVLPSRHYYLGHKFYRTGSAEMREIIQSNFVKLRTRSCQVKVSLNLGYTK